MEQLGPLKGNWAPRTWTALRMLVLQREPSHNLSSSLFHLLSPSTSWPCSPITSLPGFPAEHCTIQKSRRVSRPNFPSLAATQAWPHPHPCGLWHWPRIAFLGLKDPSALHITPSLTGLVVHHWVRLHPTGSLLISIKKRPPLPVWIG